MPELREAFAGPLGTRPAGHTPAFKMGGDGLKDREKRIQKFPKKDKSTDVPATSLAVPLLQLQREMYHSDPLLLSGKSSLCLTILISWQESNFTSFI